MKSIVTDPSVHAGEGDERIRTAVCCGTNDYEYDPRGVKLMVPHTEGCYLDAQDRQEFIVELRPWGYADKAGRRYKDNRGDIWHRFACNNTGCDGEAWVRCDLLWRFVAHGLARAAVARREGTQ